LILNAQPLGRKVRDIDPGADPWRLDAPLWAFGLQVSLPGGAPFQVAFAHFVPVEKLAVVAPGTRLTVSVDEANSMAGCAIDWDRSPAEAKAE
jgi:hypothetical protein